VVLRVFSLVLWASLSTLAFADGALKVEPLGISTDHGVTKFTAEVADTEAERERGLMFRHILPPDQAMLFDFGKPKPTAFWMKNTYIPLDMLFVRQDGTIANIAENAVPMSLKPIESKEPVRGVVELPAGTVKRLGIKEDDEVIAPIFTNK
jgi:uncharacterized protein